MTSIPPERPKCTVTVEHADIHLTVRAALSICECRELISALELACERALSHQRQVEEAFRVQGVGGSGHASDS